MSHLNTKYLVASEHDRGIALSVVSQSGASEVARVAVTDGFHLAVHPRLPLAYLSSGTDGGSVVAVGLGDGSAGSAGVVARVSGLGGHPCHTALSPDGTWLATANYEGGSVSFVEVRDGVPASLSSTVPLPYAARPCTDERQDASYPHTVYWLGDEAVLVPDLGGDVVWRVDRNSGATTVAYECPAGSGPRHLTRDRQGRLWVSFELSSRIGLLGDPVLTAPACLVEPGGHVRNYPGDLIAAGDWVVMANRGADTLAMYDGRSISPKLAAEVPSGGRWPADLAVSGDLLAVALRDSDQVGFFSVRETGLSAAGVVACERPIAVVGYR